MIAPPTMDGLKMSSQRTAIGGGVGVLVIKDGRILTGRRTDNGLIGGPGGHIEQGESAKAAAIHETQEEFGITPKKIKLPRQLDSYDKPYVFLCTEYDGEPRTWQGRLMCESDGEIWPHYWMTLDELQEMTAADLFQPFRDSLALIPAEMTSL